MYGGAIIKRVKPDRSYYRDTVNSDLKFPEEGSENKTKIYIVKKPKKGFIKSKTIITEHEIQYVDVLEVLLLLNAHLAKGTKSICVNYDGIDIATIADKYSFLGSGSFKIGATINCDDSSVQLVSFLFTDNSPDDISHEFESLIEFATNNSPFISQFYYGFDLNSLRFYFKNKIYRIPDIINTKIFDSIKPVFIDIKTRYPEIFQYLSGNTKITDEFKISTGSITMEKGDLTLDYIYNSAKSKYSGSITRIMIGFLFFIYRLSKSSDIPYAFLCYSLEIFLGFYTFYNRGYIHGDFKYDNCVWKATRLKIGSKEIDTGIIQLIDFGLSSNKRKYWSCGARSHRPFNLLPYKFGSGCRDDRPLDYPKLSHSTIEDEDLFDKEYDIYTYSSATKKRLFNMNDFDNYCRGIPQVLFSDILGRDPTFEIWSKEVKDIFKNIDNQNKSKRTKLPDAIKIIWEEFMKLDLDNQFHPINLVRKWGNIRGVNSENIGSIYSEENFPDFIVEYAKVHLI